MNRRKERDGKIIEDLNKLKGLGIKMTEAFEIVAKRWYLSADRVREIWYHKK